MIQPIAQVENPRLIRCIRFVLVCADVIELQSVDSVGSIQRLLVPAIAGAQPVFLTDGKCVCDPARFAPAQEIHCDIRIDCLGIGGKLKPCAACDVGRLIGRTLGGWLCAGRRVDIGTQFKLDVRQAGTIIFLEQQAHDLLVCLRMLCLVVQEQSGGIVSADAAESPVACSRIFVCLSSVRNDFHWCCITAVHQL